MNPVFGDTSYYGALISPKDVHHEAAVQWSRTSSRVIVLTEFVLLELGNAFRSGTDRRGFAAFVEYLRSDPHTILVSASSELFQAGMKLFAKRWDKDWSVIDCISFVVMKQQGLTEALTADRHFEQAGFKALLR
jgi:uncharacterized protein